MDFVHSMEKEYGRPAKDFLAQSFRECPTVTLVGVVFSVLSFVPIVATVALASIISLLAAIGILMATIAFLSGAVFSIVTLTILLSTVLSAVFAISVVTALVVSGVWRAPRVPKEGGSPTTTMDGAGIFEHPTPLRSAFVVLLKRVYASWPPFKPTWQHHLIAAILVRNPLARILLPRWMRYRPWYPYVFGRNRRPHPLKWVLVDVIQSRPFSSLLAIMSIPFKLARLAYHTISEMGWDSVFIGGILILLLSPRARSRAYFALGAVTLFFSTTLESWLKEVTVHPQPEIPSAEVMPVAPLAVPTESIETTAVSVSWGIIPGSMPGIVPAYQEIPNTESSTSVAPFFNATHSAATVPTSGGTISRSMVAPAYQEISTSEIVTDVDPLVTPTQFAATTAVSTSWGIMSGSMRMRTGVNLVVDLY
ncbi:hypothetical protein MSAN_00159400 [Mycena sanguinolenta]|uniref:Uncharacterized protein n=1 Tax=Mycena sanguinolenta TaxID=230812 RepID=A0A8H6X3Y4_9AGAR|nr:hypothetical protein MSAN_02417900 [Mycena sanguinolenta]KAF7377380.1 hypothetical protein MSAN_00159400 [Mycena sanguinolenta]